MLSIRRICTFIDDTLIEAGQPAAQPLRRVAVAAVVKNPYAGRFSQDLSAIVEPSRELGGQLSAVLTAAMGAPVQSYGKACLVGAAGEVEHGHAFLTSVFADQLRSAVGGGKAWISSTAKRAALGASLDVPLACKDALFVRSHYDTLTVCVPDAPEPDEAVVIIVGASGGRLNFRLGGLKYEDRQGQDGLR